MLKAYTAIVKIGDSISLDSLLGDDGEYYFGVTQICRLFCIGTGNETKTVKALLGAAFPIVTATTDLHFKAVNVVPLDAILLIIRKLDRKGNETAESLMDVLMGTSLKLLCDAAHKKEISAQVLQDTANDFHARYKARKESFATRKTWKDSLAAAVLVEVLEKTSVACTELLNLAVIGSDSATFRNFHRLREYDTAIAETYTRNYFNEKTLTRVRQIEEHATVKINKGMAPLEAVKAAIDFYEITPDDSWRSTLWSFQDPDKTSAKV